MSQTRSNVTHYRGSFPSIASKVIPLDHNDDRSKNRTAAAATEHHNGLTYSDDTPVAVPIPVPSIATEKFSLNSTQKRTLQEQGFTSGLCETMETCNHMFPLRIWIVDNSGSMQLTDGHRLVETASQKDFQCVPCSRWDEIRECVQYHAQMAALLEAPTQFHLLNHPGIGTKGLDAQHMSIAEQGSLRISSEMQHVMDVLHRSSPLGVTPLTRHIHDVCETVRRMAPTLRESGQRVALVIATDGLPSDERGRSDRHQQQRFVNALRSLEGMPVWVVVRLCTDEEHVVQFYSELDGQLELSLEVLDDFLEEGGELHKQNPWVNYTLPLHRMREMGFHHRLMDLIDERPLTRSELRDYCQLLFGSNKMDGVADPEGDWDGFLRDVGRLTAAERLQWDPVKKRMSPIINLKKLNRIYGDKKGLRKMFGKKGR